MTFKIGEHVKYEEKDVYGEDIEGKIIAISTHATDMITTYLVQLDSGTFIQFTSENLKWCKLEKPVLKRQVILTLPLVLPVVLKASPYPYTCHEDPGSPFDLVSNVA
ncbi:MAG TPA: hypothetical protein G4O15_11020 [Dehalococcoidia bacterium]|nr:hypothetical protein [Dehalococcoidia bacterium]